MRAQLVQAIVRGERPIWALLALAWIVAVVVVVRHRRALGVSHFRVFALLTLATGLSLLATTAATALSIPRIAWRTAPSAMLLSPNGETWRRVRGPTVFVAIDGVPDLAVPTVDAAGGWVLYGVLSDRVLDYPPAPPGTPEPGAARLCGADGERCRPWPRTWPSPAATLATAEFTWAKDPASAPLAYDVESGLYLRDIDVGVDGIPIELVGRIANDPPREGSSALFVVRRFARGKLEAARVVATSGDPASYRLERARASLVAAPSAFRWFAYPLLMVGNIVLPLLVLAYLVAPLWLGARLRRQAAVRRELSRELVLVPIEAVPTGGGARLATVADDADLGDALLTRGTTVAAALAEPAGRPVASRAWFELPAVDVSDGPSHAPTGGEERGAARKVGVLVPADAAPFRRTAWALLSPRAHALAMLAIGLSVAAPALVAAAALLGSR